MGAIGVGRNDLDHLSVGPVGGGSFSTVLTRMGKVSIDLTPSPLAAQSVALYQVQATGALPGDFVAVSAPRSINGIVVGGASVEESGIISVVFANPTGAQATPMPGKYHFLIIR